MKKVIILLCFVCGALIGGEFELGKEAAKKDDYEKAHKHYKLVCENGDYKGCNNLGILYDDGLGVKQDYKEAFKCYKLACNNGNYAGCYNLGLLYTNGQGVRQNYTTAKEYFGKA